MYLVECERIIGDSCEREVYPIYHDTLKDAIWEANHYKNYNPNREYRVYTTMNVLKYSTVKGEITC